LEQISKLEIFSKIGTYFENGFFFKWNKLRIGTNFENGTTFKLEEISKLEQITN
jgi:hypothetical protein